jgi:hypothetical protein
MVEDRRHRPDHPLSRLDSGDERPATGRPAASPEEGRPIYASRSSGAGHFDSMFYSASPDIYRHSVRFVFLAGFPSRFG